MMSVPWLMKDENGKVIAFKVAEDKDIVSEIASKGKAEIFLFVKL